MFNQSLAEWAAMQRQMHAWYDRHEGLFDMAKAIDLDHAEALDLNR